MRSGSLGTASKPRQGRRVESKMASRVILAQAKKERGQVLPLARSTPTSQSLALHDRAQGRASQIDQRHLLLALLADKTGYDE